MKNITNWTDLIVQKPSLWWFTRLYCWLWLWLMIHKKEKGASRSIITWQGSRQIPSSQSRSLMSSHSWRLHSPPTEWKPRTTIRNELKSTNWKWPSYPSIMQLLCDLLHNWLHSVQLQDWISFGSQNSLTSITNSTYPLSLCYWPGLRYDTGGGGRGPM